MSLCSADDVGMADTCMCCGGSASLGGTQEPWQGSQPTLRYCSETCMTEWEDYLADRDERHRKQREAEDAEDQLYADSWTEEAQ